MTDHDPPWLEALARHTGEREIKGSGDNPVIMSMFAAVGHGEIEHDETAWCAAAAGWSLIEAGYPVPPRAVNLTARSYETYGRPLREFRRGCICVFYRGKARETSWQRHVAFGLEIKGNRIRVLGGNQSDSVSEAWFPIADLVTMRWPVAATVRDLRQAGSTEIKQADTLERAAGGVAAVAGAGAAVKEALAPPQTAPLVPDGLVEQIGTVQQLMEGINAVGNVAIANPWLSAAGLACLAGVWLARRWKAGRLARHCSGDALSHPVEA